MNLTEKAEKRLTKLLPQDASGFSVEGFIGTCRGSTPVLKPAQGGRGFLYVCFPTDLTNQFTPVWNKFPGGFAHWGATRGIAGGSGMAPFLSMLAHIKNEGITRNVTYFFGARAKRDLICLDKMAAFEKAIRERLEPRHLSVEGFLGDDKRPLDVHLISTHGFFEGHGAHYRVEPKKLIELYRLCGG